MRFEVRNDDDTDIMMMIIIINLDIMLPKRISVKQPTTKVQKSNNTCKTNKLKQCKYDTIKYWAYTVQNFNLRWNHPKDTT
jgi:hypothetical protein